MTKKNRKLVLILGDQLDETSSLLENADKTNDIVVMIEAIGEASHVWNHKQRIAIFIAAMRQFATRLKQIGWTVEYYALSAEHPNIKSGLSAAIKKLKPSRIEVLQPGAWRLLDDIRSVAKKKDVDLTVVDDTHFMSTPTEFADWAEGRKALRMEYFYREMRRRHDVLMDDDGKNPAGGKWNFDQANRGSFSKEGPEDLPDIPTFRSSESTQEVLAEIEQRFPDHPGSLDNFNWPVSRTQALRALDEFVEHRLPLFGSYQDAMWQGEPFLYHALLGSSINLHLLNPREVIAAAEQAWRDGHAPIEAVEGFIRQVLGWREYIRGIYWLKMPDYAASNHYQHTRDLPAWFWTGDTEMNCLNQTISDTMENAYAHHIQRLMIVGNFSILAGLDPEHVSDWFLAVYVDAVEWVELPNVIGMALHADGGLLASKPYVSTGSYIDRMSNYCKSCRFNPKQRSGDTACPYTVLYWQFLKKNRNELERNPRMARVISNLDRWSEEEHDAMAATAKRVITKLI